MNGNGYAKWAASKKSPQRKSKVDALRILGLSGSLRAASLNTRLLRATELLAPKHITFEVFNGLGSLPIFNPDLDDKAPEPVQIFQAALSKADAVLIASPEYAHGVTGVIKNALDWVVASAEFSRKPTAVLNTAARSHHAWDALKETIVTMDANLIEKASLTVSLTGLELSAEEMSHDADIRSSMTACLETLHEAAKVLAAI